jgi:hypothetical protein
LKYEKGNPPFGEEILGTVERRFGKEKVYFRVCSGGQREVIRGVGI